MASVAILIGAIAVCAAAVVFAVRMRRVSRDLDGVAAGLQDIHDGLERIRDDLTRGAS